LQDCKYIIGVDLGTTHCVLAYTQAGAPEGEQPSIQVFRVSQVSNPGELRARPLLPSFVFLPGLMTFLREAWRSPGVPSNKISSSESLRATGGGASHRLVSSAKSWLCNSGVNRTEPLLPWDSPPEVRRISPVEASARLLEHLRNAWNHEMAADDAEARLEHQDIYLTVPASFDAVARELTVQAARLAGLEHFTLIEEPQAAFYAWIEALGDQWRKAVHVGESILVCDVGGGTTDLSLIQVAEEDGELALRRIAVGDHILLGGDNMDLSLAYAIRTKLAKQGTNWMPGSCEGSGTVAGWQRNGSR